MTSCIPLVLLPTTCKSNFDFRGFRHERVIHSGAFRRHAVLSCKSPPTEIIQRSMVFSKVLEWAYMEIVLLVETALVLKIIIMVRGFLLLEQIHTTAAIHTHTHPYTPIHTHTHTTLKMPTGLKGNSHQKLSVANMIELLLKSFLVYHSPMFKAWKVPKRPVEVSCDVTQHLAAHRTAVETRTSSSGMRTHTGQHSRLPCMPTVLLLD